jgi:hypothetical protein
LSDIGCCDYPEFEESFLYESYCILTGRRDEICLSSSPSSVRFVSDLVQNKKGDDEEEAHTLESTKKMGDTIPGSYVTVVISCAHLAGRTG